MPIVLEGVSKRFAPNGWSAAGLPLPVRQAGGRQGQAASDLEAVQEVSLTIEDGEFVCLLGPSGCGKSTLVHLIAGLETPTAGRVLVDDQPVTGPGTDRVVVFQEAALFPWLTVLGNVEFGLRMAGLPAPERQARALEFIRLVHLGRFALAYPHQLSGGMKQRVAIARALVMHPKILLMDEPFSALDAQTRALLQRELLELWQRLKITVFFVTHNVREATVMADRVFEISARPGQIKHRYAITLPRPRSEHDPRLIAIQQRVLGSLEEEIAKVVKESMDAEYPMAPRGPVVPADRNLGSHI
ncbi:MAG: ABC transporter ATP-binding protein [Candidatus Omnitrophica bacterium]|nr:ABC transporter ATP-binding protein [Candidatus Omnitrophota bacterium]